MWHRDEIHPKWYPPKRDQPVFFWTQPSGASVIPVTSRDPLAGMGSWKWESTTLDTCFKKLLTINEYELHICLGIVWDQHFQPVNLPNSQLLQPWESQNPVDLKIFITKTLVRVHNLKISPQLTPQKVSTCSVETLGIFSIFGNQNKAMLSPSQLFVLKKVGFHSFFGIAWLRFYHLKSY